MKTVDNNKRSPINKLDIHNNTFPYTIATLMQMPSLHQPPSKELPPSLFMATQFLLIVFTIFYPQPAMGVPHNNLTDLESLLAFKFHVSDPSGHLETNWTTGTSFCSWVGVYCSRKRQRVVALKLANFSLQGTISPLLSNLSFLSYLDLSNNTLTGSIPHDIGRMHRLANLSLCQNSLSGPIPSSVFNMSSLKSMYLCHNNLTGTLPSSTSLIMLPRLQHISLTQNQLVGNIPFSFARCSDIQELHLSDNKFTGSIPPEFGNLTELSMLYLGTNQLTGMIPTSLANLSKLIELDLSFNDLDGGIPEELGKLRHLEYLNLGVNRLDGSIPMMLLNASKLYFLQLCQNNLVGSVPTTIGKSLPLLTILNIRQNQLSGGLDFIASLSNCKDLVYLILSGNELQGILPDSVGNLSSHLQYFRIQKNNIKGKIPAGFGNLSSLILLDLEWNEITGELPSALARLKSLQAMFLGHMRISGSIPYELGQMTSMSDVFLEDNVLSGVIPDSLGNISGLQYLWLASNRLSSSIPNSLWSLSGLLEFNLSNNALEGSLPIPVSNLKFLDIFDLSHNRLSGNISSSLGGLQMLTYLDLSNNSFHGEIPESLGGLINLKYLNLSYNFLSGVIPKSLANLRYLNTLDISFNKLEGQIPDGRVFSNVSISSLTGNTALCGAPQLGFSPCASKAATPVSKSKLYLLKYILPPIALVVLLTGIFILLIFRWKHREAASQCTDESLNHLRVIPYSELVHATDNFSHTNLLGKGGMSSVFKAHLDDGLVAAVKVLNIDVLGSSRSFDVECHALSSVRHRNLIKFIGICHSPDFKALVLQFMENGSLDNLLYSRNLSILQRINIMVDVSLALEYLHHDHPQIVVHRDLKPSNVLLDGNMVAHVSDFGISKLLDGRMSQLSTCTPGTIGYIAPEYGATGKASIKGDVYTFGILMLETFTRKKPTDAMFNGELSLTQWIRKAHPHAIWEIVDADLIREASKNRQQSEVEQATYQCLSSIIELGLYCSRDLPNERIPMRDVVPRLQNIKTEYLAKLDNYA